MKAKGVRASRQGPGTRLRRRRDEARSARLGGARRSFVPIELSLEDDGAVEQAAFFVLVGAGSCAWQVECVDALRRAGFVFRGWSVEEGLAGDGLAARVAHRLLGAPFQPVHRADLERKWGPPTALGDGSFDEAFCLDFRAQPTAPRHPPQGSIGVVMVDGRPLAALRTLLDAILSPRTVARVTLEGRGGTTRQVRVLRRAGARRLLARAAAEAPALVAAELRGRTQRAAPVVEPSPRRGPAGWAANGCRRLLSAGRSFATKFLHHEQWGIGVLPRPLSSLVDEPHAADAEWLPIPRGLKMLADPFGLIVDGTVYVVCEAVGALSDRGHLAIASLDDLRRGRVRPLKTASHHLSYPFLIAWDGRHYCVPEAHESGRVDLHELLVEGGEARLVHRATLLDNVRLCDPTLVFHEGRFWLFATEMNEDADTHLCVFHSPSLFGPYEAHRHNPVKSDVRSARPAGSPFVHRGRLYRPAQDGAETYGGQVALQEVRRLSPDAFEEVPVTAIRPHDGGPFRAGLHTVSAAGAVTLIDGKRRLFVGRPRAFVARYGSAVLRRVAALGFPLPRRRRS